MRAPCISNNNNNYTKRDAISRDLSDEPEPIAQRTSSFHHSQTEFGQQLCFELFLLFDTAEGECGGMHENGGAYAWCVCVLDVGRLLREGGVWRRGAGGEGWGVCVVKFYLARFLNKIQTHIYFFSYIRLLPNREEWQSARQFGGRLSEYICSTYVYLYKHSTLMLLECVFLPFSSMCAWIFLRQCLCCIAWAFELMCEKNNCCGFISLVAAYFVCAVLSYSIDN